MRRRYKSDSDAKDFSAFETLLWKADHIARFPAKMSPRLAHLSLREITASGDGKKRTFHDPLCGSGTTTLVARALGLSVTAADLSYPAVIITKTKMTRLQQNKLDEMKAFPSTIEISNSTRPKSSWQNWRIWYRPKVLRAIEDIRDAIFDLRKEPYFPHLMTCFFQTSWQVSAADKGVIVPTRSRFSQRPHDICVSKIMAIFGKHMHRIVSAQQSLALLGMPRSTPEVKRGDALQESSWPKRPIDIILTSPPYGCGVDYERAFRLQMKLCDGDVPQFDKSSMIGRSNWLSNGVSPPVAERRKRWFRVIRSASDERAKMFVQYLADMDEFLNRCVKHLGENGKLCLIVGNPQIGRHHVPLVRILVRLAERYNLKLQSKPKFDRIPSRLQNFAPRSATGFISAEYLLTFGCER